MDIRFILAVQDALYATILCPTRDPTDKEQATAFPTLDNATHAVFAMSTLRRRAPMFFVCYCTFLKTFLLQETNLPPFKVIVLLPKLALLDLSLLQKNQSLQHISDIYGDPSRSSNMGIKIDHLCALSSNCST